MTRLVPPGAIATLGEQLRGRLISSDDARYDTARKVWNGRIDRRPSLIAFCEDERDAVVALRFAREHELLVAVRGGGHSCAGTAVCGDGLVIDLSHMKAIEVDAAARSAQAQGVGGAVMYAYKDALKVLRHFRDFASSAPDTLTVYACLICDGDRPVVAIAACYVGPADGAEATVAPLRKWGT